MLNLTRLHLGIAHESQFQGLGISPGRTCVGKPPIRALERDNLARFVLGGWRGKQERLIDCLSQVKSRWNIPAQVGDNCLLVYNSSFRSRVGSVCRQGDIHDATHEPKCGSVLEIDEGRMRGIANWNRNLFGARVRVVYHDGSYRLWE